MRGESWADELQRKYKRFLEPDISIEAHDEANSVILEAIAGLERVRKKNGGFSWEVPR